MRETDTYSIKILYSFMCHNGVMNSSKLEFRRKKNTKKSSGSWKQVLEEQVVEQVNNSGGQEFKNSRVKKEFLKEVGEGQR